MQSGVPQLGVADVNLR